MALACGVDDKIRTSWDSFDLTTKRGIKIEVKSSAYLQSWKQVNYYKPIFGVSESLFWDYTTNAISTQKKRHADVYVFALLAHLDKATLNPMDTNQWEFYVLNTKVIDRELANTRHASLKKILKIGALKCKFGDLNDCIESVFNNQA